ncbi:endo alpha-1,4 polygalactosaminidase [Gracilimonas sp.]|uniref:endo alpha-1,4 polygalactosaminidase n=1 Tax=Gracilimonas sp. TaxID=1974203 RepID=UPI003D0DBA44
MRTKFLFLFLIISTLFSCGVVFNNDSIDYREEMRSFVQEISDYAKNQDPDFAVIPQNGHPLLLKNGNVATDYLNAVDGLAQESLFFGYSNEDQPTPATETNQLLKLLNIGKEAGKTILVTDYCSTSFKVNNSYNQNSALGYLSFAAPDRDLTEIPGRPNPLPGVNDEEISGLSEAHNFLYLLNKSEFDSRLDFIEAVQNTNYDIIVMDAFYGSRMFTPDEVEQLRQKKNGGERMVVSYMSIGEAEDYRYYWQDGWSTGNPEWLVQENPNWEGNYKVMYWHPEWKSVIYGNEDSYLQKILDAGFDGVYLDIIDGFEFFE